MVSHPQNQKSSTKKLKKKQQNLISIGKKLKPNKLKKSKCSVPTKKKFTKGELSCDGDGGWQIVPWASSDEWENVCKLFNNEEFTAIISEIQIWKKRVPALPIGVESTLYLLQAIVYDNGSAGTGIDRNSKWSEELARSLYSLAIIRFLNHVSHLATKEMGETSSTLPMFKLASQINIPDWIVELRHEVSHGATIPSLEVLRLSAAFISNWLKENYWISPEDVQNRQILQLRGKKARTESEEFGKTVLHFISAYVAARVYKMRQRKYINDLEILQLVCEERSVETKKILVLLKTKLVNFVTSDANQTCSLIAEEMIPPNDFYQDLSLIFKGQDNFESLFLIWNPIIKFLSKKGELFNIFSRICEIHASDESNNETSTIAALWINKYLKIFQDSQESSIEQQDLNSLLPTLLNSPKPSSEIFLNRLFEMVESDVGTETVTKLAELTSIWIEGDDQNQISEKKTRNYELFTIESLGLNKDLMTENAPIEIPSKKWVLDKRDGVKFWSKVPFGNVFNV